MFAIETYHGDFDREIISLILTIQNQEAKIALPLEEQPDLKDIKTFYQKDGGEFWIAFDNQKVIGTIGLMMKENHCAVLKKFFVDSHYRSQKIGLRLYQTLLRYAKEKNIKHIILDTPAVAVVSHRFYERAGFYMIDKKQLPIHYEYPDRDSRLYQLDLPSSTIGENANVQSM